MDDEDGGHEMLAERRPFEERSSSALPSFYPPSLSLSLSLFLSLFDLELVSGERGEHLLPRRITECVL